MRWESAGRVVRSGPALVALVLAGCVEVATGDGRHALDEPAAVGALPGVPVDTTFPPFDSTAPPPDGPGGSIDPHHDSDASIVRCVGWEDACLTVRVLRAARNDAGVPGARVTLYAVRPVITDTTSWRRVRITALAADSAGEIRMRVRWPGRYLADVRCPDENTGTMVAADVPMRGVPAVAAITCRSR